MRLLRQILTRVAWTGLIAAVLLFCATCSFIADQNKRLRRCRESAEILRPLLATDARFRSVFIDGNPERSFCVTGMVQSAADEKALQHLIDETKLPIRPTLRVQINPAAP